MPLSIAAAQPALTPGDVIANVSAHADTVSAAQARVVVFPELSLTGYLLDAPAIEQDDPRLAPLVEACAETGALALAGAPVANGAGPSIGVLAVTGQGVTVAYRKMWLGGAEPERLVPGRAPTVVVVDGWRLGLAVCKDTGVAEHAADTAALGVDAYLAGVLEHAADADVQPQRARRIVAAHRVWVVIASFAGAAGGGYDAAAGGSAVWSPDGALVAADGSEPGEIARATLTARSWEAGPTRTPRRDAPSARGHRPRP
jgi:predicted amidohydrolase